MESRTHQELPITLPGSVAIALTGMGLGGHLPRVIWIARILGQWDLELEVRLDDPNEIGDIVQQIHACGKGAVREIVMHTWGKVIKW